MYSTSTIALCYTQAHIWDFVWWEEDNELVFTNLPIFLQKIFDPPKSFIVVLLSYSDEIRSKSLDYLFIFFLKKFKFSCFTTIAKTFDEYIKTIEYDILFTRINCCSPFRTRPVVLRNPILYFFHPYPGPFKTSDFYAIKKLYTSSYIIYCI